MQWRIGTNLMVSHSNLSTTYPVYAEYRCLAAIQSPRTHPIYGEEHRLLKYPCTHPIYEYVQSNSTASIEQRSSTLRSPMARCALSMPILVRLTLPFFSWTLAPRPILPIFVATSLTQDRARSTCLLLMVLRRVESVGELHFTMIIENIQTTIKIVSCFVRSPMQKHHIGRTAC